MKLPYDFYKSLLVINKKVTKELFLKKTGAEKGYALDMFSRMYDSIFSELIDLEEEYKKYYSFEYDSLEEFLFKKYHLTSEEIKELLQVRNENSENCIFRTVDHSYGDEGLDRFAFSDEMYERITSILLLK